MYRGLIRIVALLPLIAGLSAYATFRSGATPPTASLQARLGGLAALAAVTDDIPVREVKDPVRQRSF